MIEDILAQMKDDIAKAFEALRKELARVRTGRATPALLDGIRVDYYDSKTPLNQLASVSAPEPRLLLVKAWDKTAITAIEKSIHTSDLGLVPHVDGDLIRIPIPPLNEERRREFVKVIKKLGEESKVSIRNARRDSNELLKQCENDGEIPKDDCQKALKKVQELTDEGVAHVDKIIEAKEKEIMEV